MPLPDEEPGEKGEEEVAAEEAQEETSLPGASTEATNQSEAEVMEVDEVEDTPPVIKVIVQKVPQLPLAQRFETSPIYNKIFKRREWHISSKLQLLNCEEPQLISIYFYKLV